MVHYVYFLYILRVGRMDKFYAFTARMSITISKQISYLLERCMFNEGRENDTVQRMH